MEEIIVYENAFDKKHLLDLLEGVSMNKEDIQASKEEKVRLFLVKDHHLFLKEVDGCYRLPTLEEKKVDFERLKEEGFLCKNDCLNIAFGTPLEKGLKKLKGYTPIDLDEVEEVLSHHLSLHPDRIKLDKQILFGVNFYKATNKDKEPMIKKLVIRER